MVALLRQYPFGAGKAVQISQAIFLLKGTTRTATQNSKIALLLLLTKDIRSCLCLGLSGSKFLKIAKLL